MKELKIIVVLVLVAVLSGVSLSVVYQTSLPKIEQNQKKELEKAIYAVLPEASSYEEQVLNDITVYRGHTETGAESGIAFLAEGPGFQGTVRLMVGVNRDMTQITGIEVLEQVETPGLGAKISESSFEQQFGGVSIRQPVMYVKNAKPDQENEIQAITGATISSKAVVGIINAKVERVRALVQSQGQG